MTCAEALDLLGPLVDGELDLRTTAALERHLVGCDACAAERDALLALREVVRERLPLHAQPPGLERRLERTLRRADPRARTAAARRLWPAAAGALAAAALFVWLRPAAPAPEEAAFDAHLRSLQADHLTDVRSTDRHTVKPWFEGRLDFAVPVADLSAQGVVLEGGRLDHLGGRPVAALVYRDGRHALNLLLWPEEGEQPLRLSRGRGLLAARWTSGGYACWLVADVAEPEFLRVAALLRQPPR